MTTVRDIYGVKLRIGQKIAFATARAADDRQVADMHTGILAELNTTDSFYNMIVKPVPTITYKVHGPGVCCMVLRQPEPWFWGSMWLFRLVARWKKRNHVWAR